MHIKCHHMHKDQALNQSDACTFKYCSLESSTNLNDNTVWHRIQDCEEMCKQFLFETHPRFLMLTLIYF